MASRPLVPGSGLLVTSAQPVMVTAPYNPRAWKFTKSHHIRYLLGAFQGYFEMGKERQVGL